MAMRRSGHDRCISRLSQPQPVCGNSDFCDCTDTAGVQESTEVAAMRPVGTGGSAAFVSGFGRKRPEPHPERGDCAARDRVFRRASHHERHPGGRRHCKSALTGCIHARPRAEREPAANPDGACRMGLARRLRGACPVRGHFRAAPAASRADGSAAGGERVPVGIRPVPVHPRRDSTKNLSALRAGARRAGHGSGARARAFKAWRPTLEAAGLPTPDGVLVQPRLLAGVYPVLPRYRGGLR